jgi:hypothetical protein
MTQLVVFAIGFTAGMPDYLLSGQVKVSPIVEGVASMGYVFLVAVWAGADAQRRRQYVPCYGFKCLAYLCFALPMAWYCLRSRGWRGLLLIAGLLPSSWPRTSTPRCHGRPSTAAADPRRRRPH